MSTKRIIEQSHSRSEKYGIEHDMLFPRKVVTPDELSKILKNNEVLIRTTSPLMHDIYGIVKGSGFVLMLVDGNGCILELLGDEDTLKDATALNIVVGAYMAENSVGTNAIGIAIQEDKPVQVTAQEHFINAFQRWTCSSAPIHSTSGEIIGALSLTGRHRLVHPHTLGLVVAAVHSVEQELSNKAINSELQATTGNLDAIINSVSYALLTTDINGVINRVNDSLCAHFGIPAERLVWKNISTIIDKWQRVLEAMSKAQKLLDEEVLVSNVPQKGAYLMNASPILVKGKEVQGVVFAFRDMKRIFRIVNRYSGMNARYTFDDIIGNSTSIKRVIEFAKQVASSPSTILITGESGTGKEVFAQAIHNLSPRHENGFIAVNCGAIPESLFESELFGYEDGAFTGAKKGGRPGKFELANGGTLFLDEIGEMPLDMQVKLLRALQEGEITRVGGEKPIPLDVRIIAATNKDLKERVEGKNFRLDLYYRLSVIPLRISPLRERAEDIPILIDYFMRTKAKKLKKPIPTLDSDTFQMLLRYEWPGNVRELENFIEKTVNLDGKILLDVSNEQEFRCKYLNPSTNNNNSPIELKSLSEIEKDAIEKAIGQCNSMTEVAKILGISRNTLYLKCKHYGINTKKELTYANSEPLNILPR